MAGRIEARKKVSLSAITSVFTQQAPLFPAMATAAAATLMGALNPRYAAVLLGEVMEPVRARPSATTGGVVQADMAGRPKWIKERDLQDYQAAQGGGKSAAEIAADPTLTPVRRSELAELQGAIENGQDPNEGNKAVEQALREKGY
jgi:hypothetical protein